MRSAGVALCVAFMVAVARADAPDPVAARDHLREGVRHYDIQEYQQAAEEFRAAYRFDAQPDYLYSVGQAERAAGDCKRAVEAYRAFLRHGPSAKRAVIAQQQIDRCVAEEAERPLAPPAPTPAPALGAPLSPAPLPATSLAAPVPSATLIDGPPAASPRRSRAGLIAALVAGGVLVVSVVALAAVLVVVPRAAPDTALGNVQFR